MLSLKSVRDEDFLRQLLQLVKQSRGVEAEVVAHIGEVELRRLYAQGACSSMFEYCRRVLGLRENEAYLRITVARAARENPVLLEMLRDGRLHLSGIARLAPHLTQQNSEAVLKRASGMSHREIRELVSELEPRPDVAPSVRKLPERPAPVVESPLLLGRPELSPMLSTSSREWRRRPAHRSWSLSPPPATWSASQRAPSCARSSNACRPSCAPWCPTAIWRELVYERDGGRCAYRDRHGRRCAKRHDLEFHHKRPFARGGDHSPTNLTLMCEVHNTLVAEQDYGEDVMARFRAAASRAAVPVNAYGARIVVRPRRLSSG